MMSSLQPGILGVYCSQSTDVASDTDLERRGAKAGQDGFTNTHFFFFFFLFFFKRRTCVNIFFITTFVQFYSKGEGVFSFFPLLF